MTRFALILATLCTSLCAAGEVEELTQEGAEGLSVTVEPAPSKAASTDVLLDDDKRTSNKSASNMAWEQGANPSITITFPAPHLITAIEVGYAGPVRVAVAEVRQGGVWTPLPEDVWADCSAEYPNTSWLIAEDLAALGDSLRLKLENPEGSFQVTDVGLRGEAEAARAAVGCLCTSPRLPAAHRPADVMLDLRNPDTKGAKRIEVECRLLDGETGEVADSGKAEAEVAPQRSATVEIPVRMPGPGRYVLEARAAGAGETAVTAPVYVTSRELQFIWFGTPEQVQWGTMVCNVSELHELARWRRRGVIALGWAGGYCYRDRFDENGFTEYWTPRLLEHPAGIAIDEFGNHDGKPTDQQMANALVRARHAAPDKMIVAWQAGLSPAGTAQAYRCGADWVIPECYMNYFNNMFLQFDLRIKRMRDYGLMHKAVMGLSCTSDKIGTTAEGLEEQVRYIRRRAPEMPGLGFYKGYGSGEALVPAADDLCFEYFIRPTIRTEPGARKRGGVLVQNIGAMPAKDISYAFSAGEVIQRGRIAALAPDHVVQVFADGAQFDDGTEVEFRIEPSEEYSDVTEPIEVTVRRPEEEEES